MRVYRIITEIEKNILLETHDMNKISSYYIKNNSNTHNYLDNVKYLHFFNSLEGILYYVSIKGYYLCTYEINEELVNKYSGVGYYYDYKDYDFFVPIDECAIPSYELSFDNLIEIGRIEELIEAIDLFNLSKKITNIYKKQCVEKKLMI